jgi:large subunit ribosomal protein L17
MRHGDKTIKLNRAPSHRDAMLKNLASSLIKHESITTTEAKAKAVVPIVERIITNAKKGTLASERQVESMVMTKDVAKKVINVLSPRYGKREGGYIVKHRLARRKGDNTRMMKISLIEESKK